MGGRYAVHYIEPREQCNIRIGRGSMRYQTVNPATCQIIDTYETMTTEELWTVVERADDVYRDWRKLSPRERAPFFSKLGAVLREKRDVYAKLMTIEMGKPIREARAEVEKCAWLSDIYADNAERWLEEEIVEADGIEHRVVFEPLGVILSIMPWNFPFWQALRFAVPGILAGNASILKHASNVPQCAFAIEDAFTRAGFPDHVFTAVLADHLGVAALIESDRIQGVSLTGSTGAGARIAEEAGKNLKKVVLELGGSDPFIVLDDADIEFTATNAAKGRMLNTGQSCIAAKRFIVIRSVAESFSRRFAELMGSLVVGDPMDEHTEVGAIVSEDALNELVTQLGQAVDLGATILTGGKRLDRPGFFLQPTVVIDTTPEMRIVREEVFGPIAPIIVVEDEDEAVSIANATEFGLGGSVWTRDLKRGAELARRLDSGTVFVNSIVKSDPRMPFGGVKKSGIGRELSKYGLREFVNVKGLNIYSHGLAK